MALAATWGEWVVGVVADRVVADRPGRGGVGERRGRREALAATWGEWIVGVMGVVTDRVVTDRVVADRVEWVMWVTLY